MAYSRIKKLSEGWTLWATGTSGMLVKIAGIEFRPLPQTLRVYLILTFQHVWYTFTMGQIGRGFGVERNPG